MHFVRRPFFTLMEMLIVLLLLSTGIALTGVKVKQAYDEQRKLSDVQQVFNCLTMAQDLMLMMDADTEVVLKHDPQLKQVVCQLIVEKPLDKTWAKLVERQIPLSVIRSFKFTGQHDNALHLHFTLGKMSQGTLTLSTNERMGFGSDDQEDFEITLPGYPTPIVQNSNKKEDDELAIASEQLYPIEIYEELFSPAKKKN